MTGLNREKRCKLAAVFVQNLLSLFSEVEYSFVREFLQFISRIYLFFRDLCIFFNAYGNGNHRARHAAAGLLAKTRYNFTRLRSVMFLHGPWTSGWQILSIVFIVIETVGLFSRPFLPKNGSFPLQQRMADQILTQLKQHPDAWTRVDTILEYSNNQQTKVLWTGNLWFFFLKDFLTIYIRVCVFFIIVLCVTNTWSSHQDAMENSPSRAVRRSETRSYYCTS